MAKLWLAPEDTIDPTGVATNEAIAKASYILYKLTGEKYPGTYTSTDVISTRSSGGNYSTKPALVNGSMYNFPAGASNNRELYMRQTPVLSVQEVIENNRVLLPTEYTLRNNRYIVKNPPLRWIIDPVNEIQVTYTHGTPPPRAGKAAATRLANEFILWNMGSEKCALPERITSVARQGISFAILDPQDFIGQGRTGIYEVDAFIAASNPDKAQKKAAIFRQDKRVERIN